MTCYICNSNKIVLDTNQAHGVGSGYFCQRCGHVNLQEEAAEDFAGENYTNEQKQIISIYLRNDYENRGKKLSRERLTLNDLYHIIKTYPQLTPLEKMNKSLEILERRTKYVGDTFSVDIINDFPLYHCSNNHELSRILKFLVDDNLIWTDDPDRPHTNLHINAKGYERLMDIKRYRKDSRQCFVAMWLSDGMIDVYSKAIKPAIEYKEEGKTEPRFKAMLIINKEHTNDINDEIISEIRRSRFMVCDLTGYRGGVYFEAGFAYGLGLEVIYTCREDWIEDQSLKDKDGKYVNELIDKYNNKVSVKKEGIHFDLEHRNRIKWSPQDLSNFKDSLENRIKAVII